MVKIAPKLLKKDRTGLLAKALKEASKAEVLVGITQQTSGRPGEPINNAELLYIHTNGSPVRNIPARPVIEPAIEAQDNKQRITRALAEAFRLVLIGEHEKAALYLEKAGQLGEDAAKAWFTDPRNGWPPNVPSTVLRKLKKLKGKQYQAAIDAFESGSTSYMFSGSEYEVDTPLIDTGEMRKSITHVVIG